MSRYPLGNVTHPPTARHHRGGGVGSGGRLKKVAKTDDIHLLISNSYGIFQKKLKKIEKLQGFEKKIKKNLKFRIFFLILILHHGDVIFCIKTTHLRPNFFQF